MARFLVKTPHYLDGIYIQASPDAPVVIDFDDTVRTPSRTWERLAEPSAAQRVQEFKEAAVVAQAAAAPPILDAVQPVIRKGGRAEKRPNDTDLLP